MRTTNGVNGYYVADGNKNIIAVRDSNGTELSNYTYTPFGTVENPEDSDDNPFRFSSEYCDDETGLVYYNYRYYSPELGRWIKRDPIEEEGGVNLYAMAGNNPANYWDARGLLTEFDCRCAYWRAVSIFWELISEYPLKRLNQLRTIDCNEGSTMLQQRLVADTRVCH